MKRFLVTWFIGAIALLITAAVIEGFDVTGTGAAIAAPVLGIANATVRPVLSFLTFPIRLITLGLFSFVINAFTLWGVSILVTPGFSIDGPIPALVGSVCLSLITSLFNILFNPKRPSKSRTR
ncbi:phage holin family protein [Lyngbya confervoides]|uniref:Phage holin family protein n=1 Tax=Lyngbya confervoides BDU141951 TaxID=1574623 RepID=A0ABD4T6N9_9CYAN|nr:phage holin family protein [Lyngbya confervoides]MCM1984118.1 phage holin family protein [Lyngbya confervoides BDU141951]